MIPSRIKGLLFLLGLLLAPSLSAQGFDDPRELVIGERFERIVIVETPDDQTVNDFLFKKLRDEIERAATMGRVALVIRIDSGGGGALVAEQIARMITEYSEHEDLRIFAYVPRQALSAAAWIAFSARGMILHRDAVIGDIQMLLGDFRGYERAPEKITTALREKVWVSARGNGLEKRYPRLFIDAMVDINMELVRIEDPQFDLVRYMRAQDFDNLPSQDRQGRSRHVISPKGQALTTNAADMLEYGFHASIVSDQKQIVDLIGTPDAEVEIRKIRRELGIGFLDWRWIFMLVGFILLGLELKSPGIGIFGMLALGSFCAFFVVMNGWNSAALLPIVLLLLGAFLIIIEVDDHSRLRCTRNLRTDPRPLLSLRSRRPS